MSEPGAVPGWLFPVAAAGVVIGAFGFGMWLLDKPKKLGALGNLSLPNLSLFDEITLRDLTSRYAHVLGLSQEPSGMVLVRFIDENGKEQTHDWYFDGKDWRCGLTGKLT